jgi:hypothetical protein
MISAIKSDDSRNDNERTYFDYTPYHTNTTVKDQSHLIILGSMHTHVPQSITSMSEQNNLMMDYGTHGAGVSTDDISTASVTMAPSYALAKYKIDGVQGNIYKVDSKGSGADSKTPVTNINNVRSAHFNLIRDVIKSNISR